MPATVVLFDLDGTLTDPGVGIRASVAHALERMGQPAIDDVTLNTFIGPPLQDRFMEHCSLDAEGAAQAVEFYREYFVPTGMFENAVYDGIPGVLHGARMDGMRLGLATSKPHVFATQILDHFALGGYFDVIVGPELDGTRRHKADVIEHALALLDADPATTVMVGDRDQDVRGATAHGIDCIGVTWGYGTEAELREAGAISVVETRPELTATIRQWG